MKAIAMLLIFLFVLVWIGFAVWGLRKKRWSWTVSVGGGFLVAGILFAFAGLFIPDAPPKTVQPVYNSSFNSKERALAEKAFSVFCEACQPLMGKYSEDIESISIERGFDRGDGKFDGGCFDYRCREYGWDKQIYIKVKLKDKQDVIPRDLRAWGHTLHIYLGGPVNPGITVPKFPQLCGAQKPTDGSFDAFILVPKLAFLKK